MRFLGVVDGVDNDMNVGDDNRLMIEEAIGGDGISGYDGGIVAVTRERLGNGGVRDRERLRERVDAH